MSPDPDSRVSGGVRAQGSAPRLPPLVVIAAGRSSRLGQPKGLVLVEGCPWIALQLERFAAAGGTRAIVVTRPELAASYRAACAGALAGADVIENARADELGPFSSLQLGLARAGGAAFVCPVDVPFAGPAVWRALSCVVSAGAEAAVPELGGRGGHPVLLSAGLLERVLRLDPVVSRLDEVLRRCAVRIPVEDRPVVTNLNTAGDWAALRASGLQTGSGAGE